MRCFAISRSLVDSRLDPLNFINPAIAIIAKSQLPLLPIGDVALSMKAGFAAGKQDQAEEGDAGILQIRPTNMSEEGELHFDKSLSVKSEIVRAKKINAIKRKTILFNNTNSQEWVGKTAFFDLEGEYVTSNHITSICVDEKKVSPKYLWIVLNTLHRIKYFYNVCTNWNNQSGVNVELLRQIKIPVPDRAIQDQIVALMDKAYAEKKALEAEADKLLASIDSYMLDQLGIALPRSTSRVCHSVLLSELVGKRCDPMPYQPLRLDMIKAISKGKYELKSLQEITAKKSSQEKENPSTLPYVGLENIGSNTGVYVESKDEKTEFGSALHFYPDNILFPKLRPYLNKVYHSTMEGFCSTEFHVLEAKPEILPSYLVAFLRSQAVVRQTSCLMTGNTLPRLQTEDVQTLPIPVPPKTVQKEMVSEVEKRRAEALRLKKQSMAKIDQAKAEVEKILFGGTA